MFDNFLIRKIRRRAGIAVLVIVSCLLSPVPEARADQSTEIDRQVRSARDVLQGMIAIPEDSIPEELLARCRAVVIYPSVIKGGFILGGRYGKGVVLKREKATGKWGPLAFTTITGLSVGFQAGVQATDLVLVIMNNRGLERLLSTKLVLGGDAAISIGPIGRNAEMATDISLQAGILSYSRSRGLFGGAALNGSIVAPDNAATKAYYQKDVTVREVLLGENSPSQPSAVELANLLNDYSGRWAKRKTWRGKT